MIHTIHMIVYSLSIWFIRSIWLSIVYPYDPYHCVYPYIHMDRRNDMDHMDRSIWFIRSIWLSDASIHIIRMILYSLPRQSIWLSTAFIHIIHMILMWSATKPLFKLYVSFAKEPYERRYILSATKPLHMILMWSAATPFSKWSILQKRPIILRSLLIVATPCRICCLQAFHTFHWKCYTSEIHPMQKLKFLGTNSN